MRTSINLDADVYDFASAYAHAKGITLGAAINELIRCAEQAPEPKQSSTRVRVNEYGYPEVMATGQKITPEMVKEAAEDELV